MVKNLPAMQEIQLPSLVWEDPLEKGMATHASILVWRILWTEEPGGLHGVAKNWTQLSEKENTLKKRLGKNVLKCQQLLAQYDNIMHDSFLFFINIAIFL